MDWPATFRMKQEEYDELQIESTNVPHVTTSERKHLEKVLHSPHLVSNASRGYVVVPWEKRVYDLVVEMPLLVIAPTQKEHFFFHTSTSFVKADDDDKRPTFAKRPKAMAKLEPTHEKVSCVMVDDYCGKHDLKTDKEVCVPRGLQGDDYDYGTTLRKAARMSYFWYQARPYLTVDFKDQGTSLAFMRHIQKLLQDGSFSGLFDEAQVKLRERFQIDEKKFETKAPVEDCN